MDDKRDRSLSIASLSSSFSSICNIERIMENSDKKENSNKKENKTSLSESKYEFYILRRTCLYITDFDDLLDEYKTETNLDYVYNITDINMVRSIIKLNKSEFRIVKVRRYFTPYVEIISHVMYDDIKINYDKFKIDKIKSILSSDRNSDEVVLDIEQICFYDFDKIQMIEIY